MLRWGPRLGVAFGATLALGLGLAHQSSSQGTDPTLTVRVLGDGKVTSSPAGIDCEPGCSSAFPRSPAGVPQVVQLTAVPGAGQQLESWGDACSGAGPCSVTMDANKVVSARFGPAPVTGQLVVELSAGGVVSGASGAIACPPGCAATLPLGSAFELVAVPRSGFRFERWEGACTGAGGCQGSVAPRTYVRAVFAPVAPARPAPARDADRDGVPNGRDACPGTLRGGNVRLGGCSAVDLVRDPDGALDPLRESIASARGGLGKVPGLGPVARQLAGIRKLLAKGDALMGRGAPCDAAGRLRLAARRLGGADKKATTLIDRLQDALYLTPLVPNVGDASEKDIQWAELNLRRRLVGAAADKGAAVRKAFQGACRSFRRRIVLRGVVAGSDDATGILRLGGKKRRLLLAPGDRFGNRVFEGARVKVVGRGGKSGGPVLVSGIDPAQTALPSVDLGPCMQLRIAPFQDFSGGSPVLHRPSGYRKDGVLQLEAGARLAASPKCESGKGRYSLSLELGGAGFYTVAEDLTAGDDPVQLPVGGGNTLWTLTVRERRQLPNCPPPSETPGPTAAKSFPCPVKQMSKTDYKVVIRNTGAYGTAEYSSTNFTLSVDAPAFVAVTGLDKHPKLPATAAVEGDGYNTTGTVNTGNYQTLKQGETWTLYPKELYGFTEGLLFPLETLGVDHFAGMVWPRIVGKRNGQPFRYAATLPQIVTDLLAFCPGMGENCAYAAPWPFLVEYGVGQGNGPGFSHNDNQLYAFDFSMPTGAEIRAARGGIVGDVVEDLTTNYNPCDPATPNADGPGNYVRIDHQDGTYAYYVHLKTNTVPLQEGDEIGRGEVIGEADNTGRSCGEHLHFQVSSVNTNTYYGQTVRIRFNTWVLGQESPYAQDCYIPQSGDTLVSTNG